MTLRPPSASVVYSSAATLEVAAAPSGAPGSAESFEQLRAENAVLRARVAELEQARARAGSGVESRAAAEYPVELMLRSQGPVAESDVVGQAARENQNLLSALIDNSPSLIFMKDVEGRMLLANRRYLQTFHTTLAELRGRSDDELWPPEMAARFRANDLKVMTSGQAISIEERVRMPDGDRIALSVKFPVYGMDGTLVGVCGIATDITDQKRGEQERVALQEQVIAAQRIALHELSTPLIPIAEGVLAMPLVGGIDSTRAQQILETLLEGISKHGAHTAILDITGVRVVDSQVASALVGAARAARLLGARVLLTGIRSEVAQTLVGLGADLTGIVTLGTLQSGIAHALGR